MASSIECTRCFMKKFIISCIFLIICAVVVFFLGWVQLTVPNGSVAVFMSKTSGIDPKPIQAGSFSWRWEKLLPTNTEIRTFSIFPIEVETKIEAALPSAEIYRAFLEGRPDFSYEFEILSQIKLRDTALPQFVRKTNAISQEELETYLKIQGKKINNDLVSLIIQESYTKNVFLSLSNISELAKNLEEKNPEIEIVSLEIVKQKMPDIEIYLLAKEAYFNYQDAVRNSLTELAKDEASKSAQDFLQIERFTKWGKVLQDYPILIDFIAVSKEDAASALEALKKIR